MSTDARHQNTIAPWQYHWAQDHAEAKKAYKALYFALMRLKQYPDNDVAKDHIEDALNRLIDARTFMSAARMTVTASLAGNLPVPASATPPFSPFPADVAEPVHQGRLAAEPTGAEHE